MFQSSTGIKTLFYINVSVFLFMSVLSLFKLDLTWFLACWNYTSPNFGWYQLITSQFVHGGIFHLLGNMLALISLGPFVESFINSTKKFYFYYLLFGLVGGILQSLFTQGPCVGASGAVWGIVMMFAFLNPNAELSIMFLPFGIKSKYLVGFLFIIEFICCIFAVNDNIGHWAHFGGAMAGMSAYFLERKVFGNRNG